MQCALIEGVTEVVPFTQVLSLAERLPGMWHIMQGISQSHVTISVSYLLFKTTTAATTTITTVSSKLYKCQPTYLTAFT